MRDFSLWHTVGMYKRTIAAAAIVGISLLIINWVANTLYWYTSIWWFDMLMHTVGGMFVAFIGGAMLLRHLRGRTPHELFIILVLFVFVVGLFWEYYEYIVQFYIKTVHLADVPDSISDLVCDMVGGVIASIFVIVMQKRYNTE